MYANKNGSVLLLAVLVMSGVVITSMGVGSLVLSSLKQTRVIDSAAVAYYAAESGVEEAMFDIRRRETPLSELDREDPHVFLNGASWTRDVEGKEDVVFLGTLPQNSFLEIALYDSDDPTLAQGFGRVDISWSDTCGGCSVLYATLVEWVSGSSIVWNPNAATFTYTGGSASISADASKLYRLRLAARQGGMENVRVAAFDDAGLPKQIPGRVRIDGRGNFGGVAQTLTVTFPRESPLGGVFDFVLFSECSLVKGESISCP